MGKLLITKARRYLAALKRSKNKFETRETLAKELGYYPEVIADDLAQFDPMIRLDYEYDLKTLIPVLEQYVDDLAAQRKKEAPPSIRKKDTDKYDGVGDFVYKEMTIGASGLINRNVELSEKQLRILRRLINAELKQRKEAD